MGIVAALLFLAFATLSIAGAAGLILFRHPLNCAVSFIITLISLAGLYALLSAKVLFAFQIIVYAGAIMSLILFIIMFINVRDEDLPDESNRIFLMAGGCVFLVPIAWILLKAIFALPYVSTAIVGDGFGGIHQFGMMLFTDWILPFEVVSALLLVALVGGVVLAKRRI
ncbi:NADH-quinone oxidoreductase subunit J [Desulfurispirillum indicum]|uniref:NADH-quinone oxidoreductase subunit J n=1 Tax=Desulfurispirillum indicum (strain ATCC BAA-1389 / DSM 22839 / S5) TaxID=653733 RepID=E6W2N8_DESIS|nr:NADH-quinone oxidoreductase subunit J [Desulfurispirillum indicum]ADU65622.1 NADH-ubiquinone/plastoquinone oxidoreductase chain 6 [Desulfurispirillum indicum S5]UCZ57543.1 NADH-quinone oxidoreductase subunit J [Desulfurispirillum indicum]